MKKALLGIAVLLAIGTTSVQADSFGKHLGANIAGNAIWDIGSGNMSRRSSSYDGDGYYRSQVRELKSENKALRREVKSLERLVDKLERQIERLSR